MPVAAAVIVVATATAAMPATAAPEDVKPPAKHGIGLVLKRTGSDRQHAAEQDGPLQGSHGLVME
jgi:hypothetical protein